ncbi:UDP-N-acetylenolpyruvoylglucosamine reductase [Serratia sp. AS12]|uniref:UDP-N-acetylmuramate dehydrogenase n=1 Tax=Serratia TaxID=613 RepID=UPI00020E963F|nr:MULTISPECIES: UDP-N-acetylmuramate dehydrogenase [Serratia]AEF43385.1 UDP-N-acetylenolpyruvoylglucosamine reductase [Serratia plymuthica AS9]AEF48337.1 UDP-N-acetylenolpyruvoylglucosamine reductase [Serratia sp. AS12]AEG26045.1 UDP-N-acetylenolpyruvoylglucosamine reductase [Serratia sp. AS13]UTN96952.1 UDP-N-acetylmuramate dehydrogenase [Serratia plymuthica]
MSTERASLKTHNTFALPVNAAQLVIADRIELMIKVWQKTQKRQEPLLVLGEGSNVLFLEDFAGTVMINQFKGIDIREETDAWYLHVGAGENWHGLVCNTLDNGIPGLENLALIPGLVGSAPIQNIGAYGIELKSVCDYVDLLDFNTGAIDRIPTSECGFGYRESIFKHDFQTGHIIVGVGLRLSKQWSPMLNYGDLTKLDPETVTPRQIFESVCAMRRSKLPDPAVTGNAGSFFKNPLVSEQKGAELVALYPGMPHYPQQDGQVKLAAGWLIDQCELKGYQIGGAAVHRQQALVLVNLGDACSQDVVALARHVRNTVAKKFDVWLEPEVRFIGATGERNAVEVLS